MSGGSSQIHLSVCNELEGFISQTKAFRYRVRVTFKSEKKHYGSKVGINISRRVQKNVHHNHPWIFVSRHVRKVCSDCDLNILRLLLLTLQVEVESLYNYYN